MSSPTSSVQARGLLFCNCVNCFVVTHFTSPPAHLQARLEAMKAAKESVTVRVLWLLGALQNALYITPHPFS